MRSFFLSSLNFRKEIPECKCQGLKVRIDFPRSIYSDLTQSWGLKTSPYWLKEWKRSKILYDKLEFHAFGGRHPSNFSPSVRFLTTFKLYLHGSSVCFILDVRTHCLCCPPDASGCIMLPSAAFPDAETGRWLWRGAAETWVGTPIWIAVVISGSSTCWATMPVPTLSFTFMKFPEFIVFFSGGSDDPVGCGHFS